MTSRVLLIDDDARLYELLASYLSQNGFDVEGARDGSQGLQALAASAFDAVVLDVMMPGMSGLEACRRIREQSRIPILMLTAKGDETDRVVGLELGADDYISKPFSPRELLARLRAVLRRSAGALDGSPYRLTIGQVVVDGEGRQVTLGGQRVDLTALEFDLLVALAKRTGRVVPREQLLALAGRSGVVVGERTVDVHISHLRRKLGDDGVHGRAPRLIKTVRGVGYVMTKDEA
jgi:two-component system, OmpR family, response regulator